MLYATFKTQVIPSFHFMGECYIRKVPAVNHAFAEYGLTH